MDALVLDTHIWIWLMMGSPELKRTARQTLEQAAARTPLLVPAICVWELAMLDANVRIKLPKPIHKWVDEAFSGATARVAELSPEIAITAVQLPGQFQGDPADRLIVATARVLGLPLATRDQRILDYAKTGVISVVPG